MKNSEVWSQYKTYTKDVTEHSRKIAFAGAALCWVLKLPDGSFSNYTLIALCFFIGNFITDFLQSMSGALILRFWIRKEELNQWRETESIEGEYLKPAKLDYPAFALFLVKIILLFIGFGFVGIEILSRAKTI